MQCIFKALFTKKPNYAFRAEATPIGRSKKSFHQKLRIVICNNFCLEFFLCNAFLRHFSPKNRIVLSGQRPHPWADFARMQYRPRFLSYKIKYKIWLSSLNYFLSYSVHRQTHRQTDTHTHTHTHRRHAKNDFFGLSGPQNVKIHQNLEIDFLGRCNTLYFVAIAEKVKKK